MEHSDLLDIKGAAKRLGMSVSWLYKRSADGSIPKVKLGKAVRFCPKALDAYKTKNLQGVLE